jgi:DNA-binding response OmpR family regulator
VERSVRILAVDNEPSVTLSLRYVFPPPQFDITCAESGHAALVKVDAAAEPFDVILVDEKMPNLSGSDLVREMRNRGIRSKIIVVSAHLSAETREAYERMDVHVMFSKPFNVEVLRAAVSRVSS